MHEKETSDAENQYWKDIAECVYCEQCLDVVSLETEKKALEYNVCVTKEEYNVCVTKEDTLQDSIHGQRQLTEVNTGFVARAKNSP